MPTHGSLTKAGKVRGQTPKMEASVRVSPTPRTRTRRTFVKRYILKRRAGQNSMTRRRF